MENRGLFRKTQRAFYLLFGARTWRAIEYFDPSWSNRIREMAKYIAPNKSILDLGCGKMWLRKYLQMKHYYPIDYKSRGQGTIICDFNKNEFPSQNADVAFVSGTLEYVNNASWFVNRIGESCHQCVISYCLLEDYPDLCFRRKQAWMNDYSHDEIIQMFSNAGFQLASESQAIPKNRILSFIKETATVGKPL